MRTISARRPRILFLDDDPERAAAFHRQVPDATWVATVPECLDRLREPWDEVHLDHDLGGERNVDPDRHDCGMAIVRRLAEAPHEHLRHALFVVHSHNPNAACMMMLHLEVLGFRAEARPFRPREGHTTPSRLLERLRLAVGLQNRH